VPIRSHREGRGCRPSPSALWRCQHGRR
jgi:hypothetical protein